MASGWDFLSGFFGSVDESVKAREAAKQKMEMEKALLKLRSEQELSDFKFKEDWKKKNTYNNKVVNSDGTYTMYNDAGEPLLNAKGEPSRIKDESLTLQINEANARIAESQERVRHSKESSALDRIRTNAQANADNARAAAYRAGGGSGGSDDASAVNYDDAIDDALYKENERRFTPQVKKAMEEQGLTTRDITQLALKDAKASGIKPGDSRYNAALRASFVNILDDLGRTNSTFKKDANGTVSGKGFGAFSLDNLHGKYTRTGDQYWSTP